MTAHKPFIAISAGDPAGIGPEICIKALAEEKFYERCRPLVICNPDIMRLAAKFSLPKMKINEIDCPEEGYYSPGYVNVLKADGLNLQDFSYGKVSPVCGRASFEYVKKAIDLALQGNVDAIVTAPINKESLHQAGINFPGHTEIFAHYTRTKNVAMMLADAEFRVIHVTTHVSMRKAIDLIQKERVFDVIKLAHTALKSMKIKEPRIAVCGLNPHAGENGLFGNEEFEHIIPAINEAKKEGIKADGPHSPDTIFPKMKGGQYDIVVCMYHDQGHIPTKLTGFRYDHQKKRWEGLSGVNITLGLPVVRVSVDHGTAFDKAGKGEANPESMIQAINYAIQFSSK